MRAADRRGDDVAGEGLADAHRHRAGLRVREAPQCLAGAPVRRDLRAGVGHQRFAVGRQPGDSAGTAVEQAHVERLLQPGKAGRQRLLGKAEFACGGGQRAVIDHREESL